MKKFLLLSSLLASVLSINAQVTPKVQPETLVNGKQYVLVNKAQTATQYMSRTSWDGAYYFLGESDSKYADHAFMAVDNGDGSWSFVIPNDEEEGAFYYMAIPAGTDNLNIEAVEPVKWTVTASEDAPGFYRLTAGEGNNPNCMNKQLHLNAGAQFFVISEPADGAQWFPDIAGGATMTGEYDENDDEIIIVNDYTSFNWGFVQVENIPAYYADAKYSATINKFYADYCDLDDYGQGFMNTYEIVAKAYNEAADEDDLLDAGILEMMNAKVALYKEIDAAIALNENDDAVLAAAIVTAKAAFDSKTATTEVESATKTLKNAEVAYSTGTGDITSMGTNMSFEDLSAQDGGQTTSVAGVPVGWNIYINGNQVNSADEVRAAGITGWHGVNDDSEGEIKDGSMSFGIWNTSIPTYEISQTIKGLETGTYEITAGLMAGSNGGGSRLTTQRIFGNLNSTYYASEYDYNVDELDKLEVYDFAGNEILVTDREMRPVVVNAFVYDGTLTFGVRTDGNAKANAEGFGQGGSGWFKTDNFTIINKGYVAEDAVEVFEHYADLLDVYEGEPMAAVVADQMLDSSLGNISTDSKQEDIVAAILTAKELLVTVDASVKAYQKLAEAIELHWGYLEQYDNKMGAGEYGDAISDAEEVFQTGSADDEAAIDAIIEGLNEALQACIQSDAIEEGADLTDYIKNHSFEDLSAQGNVNSDGTSAPPAGWNLYMNGEQVTTAAEVGAANGGGWCAINSGDNLNDVTDGEGNPVYVQYTDGEHLWGLWSNAVPVVELSQTIKGLPAGQYTLTADIVVQNDWAGMNLGMQHLFANDYVTMFGAESDYIQNADEELYGTFPADVRMAAEIDKQVGDVPVKHLTYAENYQAESYGASGIPYTTKVVFGLAEKGDVTIGFRSCRISAFDGLLSDQASMGWFKLDNFTLTYDSATVPEGADKTSDETAIATINTTKQTAVAFYSTNGTRLAAPQKGINIVKMGDGSIKKVLVK